MSSTLISIETGIKSVSHAKPMTVAAFIEAAEVDLSKSTNVSLHIGIRAVTLEDIVQPGETVLLAHKIAGG